MESILCLDTPIQMISCTDTNGKITPIRFKFQDKNGEIIMVDIDHIIKSEQDKTAFGAAYTCSAVISRVRKTFTLRYNYQAHEWRLTKIHLC